ncbi:DEAD-domain-containing protein [Eremomyces bilateralis CBS 781.70]|uniref:ATP-dependent RNA helicase n=1 Tax=Eremomyces bilateralis CBS 781.70 TaxID=1392243 RepID=A0A6G1G7V9_9PEZI|nr:DEAD-domain-containing protein [Eremomyces bilateralis CBS 781.70]KAF1814148.1 DEAD-domain-containing protein [Eremomyces bilateralis CBS 781.70]
MADDGMLLNFEVGDGPLAPEAKLKGGNWKARMQARNAEKRRTFNRFTRAYGGDESAEGGLEKNGPADASQRPVKRQRVEEQGYGEPRYTKPSGGTGPHFQRPEKGAQGSKPFVASLFSYNPANAPPVPADNTCDIAPSNVEASNAPLDPEAYNFINLGVSPTIAGHLTKKMEFKAPTAVQKSAIPKLLEGDADAFIQAETGSGKTLAYLLPLVQKIMDLQETRGTGNLSPTKVSRDSGLFGIILAPTRELCKQIATVLETLLRCVIYIVPGTVFGGENKQKEKSRLRKGLNILVATPGRLIDHLQNTKSLDLSLVRWLVLDEGDRLMELGFEDDIKQLLGRLDENMSAGQFKASRFQNLPQKRTTILCSATMRMDVQRLGDMSLRDAIHVQADNSQPQIDGENSGSDGDKKAVETQFLANRQLNQSYLVTPPKLRLVSLVALIRRALTQRPPAKKIIVFISCADSVDFHFTTLTMPSLVGIPQTQPPSHSLPGSDTTSLPAALLAPSSTGSSTPETPIVFRLHSSLPQSLRQSTLTAFTRTTTPAILLTTDLSSRGLDLPIDLVVELDAAASLSEHLHRVGRTARAGREGKATVLLSPGLEEGYAEALKGCVHKDLDTGVGVPVRREEAEGILSRVFSVPDASGAGDNGPKKTKASKDDWRTRATDLQMYIERWIAADTKAHELAIRAFQSHVRAYSTHVASERKWFDVKDLHLGHAAKAFGVREAPGNMNMKGMRGKKNGKGAPPRTFDKDGGKARGKDVDREASEVDSGKRQRDDGGGDGMGQADVGEAKRKMRKTMNAMMAGASEFNLG